MSLPRPPHNASSLSSNDASCVYASPSASGTTAPYASVDVPFAGDQRSVTDNSAFSEPVFAFSEPVFMRPTSRTKEEERPVDPDADAVRRLTQHTLSPKQRANTLSGRIDDERQWRSQQWSVTEQSVVTVPTGNSVQSTTHNHNQQSLASVHAAVHVPCTVSPNALSSWTTVSPNALSSTVSPIAVVQRRYSKVVSPSELAIGDDLTAEGATHLSILKEKHRRASNAKSRSKTARKGSSLSASRR